MLTRRALLKANFRGLHPPVRLPWLRDADAFVEFCTRCSECIKSCPEKIIIQGDGGFPEINFRRGECTFCTDCVYSCPENLFTSPDENPWRLKAQISEQCLTLNNIICVSCKEQCEAEAIKFLPLLRKASQPILSIEQCTGCGACVRPCPADAINLIYENEFNYQQVENI